jgi:chromosomal replication initiation ATPase DnaA
MRRLRRDSFKEIGEVFGLEKCSSVSSVIERMKTRMQNDRKIKAHVKKIGGDLRKKQE